VLNDPVQPGEVFTQGGGGAGGSSDQGGTGGSGNPGGRPPQNFVPRPGPGPLPSGMPPAGENRFIPNEVAVQLGSSIPEERIEALMREFGLETISRQTFTVLGRTVYRFRILSGKTVREVIRGFEALGATVSAQPSYAFELTQDAAMAGNSRQGDSSQY